MNWKNVLYLLRVERKSGRLIRRYGATKYRENRVLAYWPYWLSAIIGVIGGYIANVAVASIYLGQPAGSLPDLKTAAQPIFVVLPTAILIFSFVFTLLQQIQLAGIKTSGQVAYWLPITWQEQTMASVLSNLLGLPIAFVIGVGTGAVVFGAFNGLVTQALLTFVAMAAAAFLASITTEILRLLQMRFIGAVYKSSGKAAIWVRLAGTLFFFIIFYVLYFYVIYGTGSVTLFNTLSHFQSTVWYVPFIWIALIVSYLFSGLYLQAALFIGLSALFIAAFYYAAVILNQHFGLYEPPAITLQKSGTVYAPKTGLLGKIGFSSTEAAIIRKDFRAFTRRREMVSVFIVPIIMIILPIMESFGIAGGTGAGSVQSNVIFSGIIFFLPASFMATLLGEIMIGEEGQAVWRIYASPISPKNLVKSKTFFVIVFSTAILFLSNIIGALVYHTNLQNSIAFFLTGFFTLLAVGSAAVAVGFKGPDFSQTRRARMVRQEWALIGLIVCGLCGAFVLAPLIVTVGLALLFGGSMSILSLFVGVAISAAISIGITIALYYVNLGFAADFLKKA